MGMRSTMADILLKTLQHVDTALLLLLAPSHRAKCAPNYSVCLTHTHMEVLCLNMQSCHHIVPSLSVFTAQLVSLVEMFAY